MTRFKVVEVSRCKTCVAAQLLILTGGWEELDGWSRSDLSKEEKCRLELNTLRLWFITTLWVDQLNGSPLHACRQISNLRFVSDT